MNPSEVITDFITKAGFEVKDEEKKLKPQQIPYLIKSTLSMDDIGFITMLWFGRQITIDNTIYIKPEIIS